MIKFMWVGLIIGGIVGQFIPSFWGADPFSITSSFFSLLGGGAGLWLGFKIDKSIGQ